MTDITNNKILLVEDDAGVAASLQDALQREGYAIHHVETGQDALQYVQQHPSHLIVLDVRLPDTTGFDVCREMRQIGLHQPIIMLTVQGDLIDRVLGLEMGADDYLTKPFHFRELLSRIKAQLRRSYGEFAGADSNLLYVGDLIVDRTRGEVRRGERVLNLTPVEFRLLVYLAQNRNQALSRSQILEAVWGYDDTPGNERTVNSHIRRLREKIEYDPGDPRLIETVMGIGYRLNG